jgi:4-hydroxybenzoate polyprenyltransferase
LNLALSSYAAALMLCWFYFNPISFFILLAAIISGSLYSSYLRDRVGYLSLPPIEGLIFLCGWACLAPETVFATLLPWYLYFLGLVWQSAHILAHYVLNIRQDVKGKTTIQTPVLFSRLSAQTAAKMTLGLTMLLLIMCLALPWLTPLNYLYLIPVAGFGIYTLFQCRAFWQASSDGRRMHRAWSSLSLFRLVISAAIILAISF